MVGFKMTDKEIEVALVLINKILEKLTQRIEELEEELENIKEKNIYLN